MDARVKPGHDEEGAGHDEESAERVGSELRASRPPHAIRFGGRWPAAMVKAAASTIPSAVRALKHGGPRRATYQRGPRPGGERTHDLHRARHPEDPPQPRRRGQELRILFAGRSREDAG